jgi:acetoin utilization deacetylase AcuC-like enzyme
MDVHVNDPFGGILTEEQIYERDLKMFRISKELGIPICWNLAGGYQVDKDGKFDYVLKLHLNTFKACREVYN